MLVLFYFIFYMPATTLVKNPPQPGHCKDTFTLLHLCNRIMAHHFSDCFLSVVGHMQEGSALAGPCQHQGDVDFGHPGSIVPHILTLGWHCSGTDLMGFAFLDIEGKPSPCSPVQHCLLGRDSAEHRTAGPLSPPLSHQAPSVGIPSPCHSTHNFPYKGKTIMHFYQ